MTKGLISLGSLLAAIVLFVAANVLAGAGLARARLDLTENRLYTLSAGSKNIARKLDEPIRLTLYYSEKQSSDVPANYKSFGTRVKEVLREYALASGGKIALQVVNPEPFSEAEDKAVQAGLMGAPIGRSRAERFYFGLVGVNSTDKQETVPFFRPDREEFLEYQLTRMIYLLSEPRKKAIGVMSWLPIEGTQGNPMMGRQGTTPPWQFMQQVKELFEVRTVERDVAEIPADVKVLMVVHPKGVPDKTLYAIDQFVLKGGRVLVFVDPLCEADVPPGINPMQAMQLPRASDLKRLFEAWGVEMVEGKFAGDRANAMQVNVGTPARPEPVDYVGYLKLRPQDLDRGDSITGELQGINLATAGVLRPKSGVGTTLLPLIHTSGDAMGLDVSAVSFMPDPKKLLSEFVPGGGPLTIGARVTGRVKSAFPDGKPAAAPKPGEATPPSPVAEEAAKEDPKAGHVAESAEAINVVIVADCDMLTDRFWVSEVRAGGMVLGYDKSADNADLVIGALDNLSGSSDLISVRARASSARPFDRIERLQKDAEQVYLAKEQQLQTKLRETETKINDLQKKRPEAAGGSLLLSPEQKAEIEKFKKEKVEIGKQLREVQHQLRKDIERLDAQIRFVNIALVPLLVGGAAVGLGVWRGSRRRVSRWEVKART